MVYDYLSVEQAGADSVLGLNSVRDILGKCGADRRILLKRILPDISSDSVDWIQEAQNRIPYWPLVNR